MDKAFKKWAALMRLQIKELSRDADYLRRETKAKEDLRDCFAAQLASEIKLRKSK